jgi:hypothetical protein
MASASFSSSATKPMTTRSCPAPTRRPRGPSLDPRPTNTPHASLPQLKASRGKPAPGPSVPT